MKAQSAIEYLTTYGWMLIVVSIVSGVAYTQIGTQCVESAAGFTGQSINVNDFGVTANSDELAFALENRRSDRVTVDEIILIDESGESINYTIGENIGPGSEKGVTVRGVIPTEECNTVDMQIEYSIGIGDQLTGQKASGSITSNILIGEGNAPAAPEGLEASYNG